MTFFDLLFLASFVFCMVLVVRLLWLALRRQWTRWRTTGLFLATFVVFYAAVLVAVALSKPRRELAAGERKCFDDWCTSATALELQPSSVLCEGAATVWVAAVEVSSVARRIQQRAADATVEVEALSGRRYRPCVGSSPHTIRDLIGPGEKIPISIPFALPAGERPAGLVVRHGAFPGLIIIGDDQSWLHPPTLFRTAIR